MTRLRLIILLAVTLIFFGCAKATVEKTSSVDFGQNTKVMVYNAGMRGVLLNNTNGKLKICAEPAPDASTSDTTSEGLNLSYAGQKEGEEEADEEGEGSLGGRNSTVLLTREAFYRLCEMYISTDMTTDQYMQLFNSVLEYSAKIGDEVQAKYETTISSQTLTPGPGQGSTQTDQSDQTDQTDTQ